MLCLIQARTSSKRFPKKVLTKIGNKTIIEMVVARVKKSKKISKIIVTTSKNKGDDELVKLLIKKKINFFRGSLTNVAKRCYQAAVSNNSDFFLRISGDSPLIDAKLIDKVISKSKKRLKKLDLITNVFPRTFPKGQSIEIINNSKLYSVLRLMNKSEKENVTEYFYNNNKKFKIMNFKYKKDYSEINMTVDYKKDLNFIRLIDKKFNNNVTFNKIINYILIYKI